MAAPDTNRRQFLTGTAAVATVAPLALIPEPALAANNDRDELGDVIAALPVSFAVAWLAEWTKRGGSYMRHGDQWLAGWPEGDGSPGYPSRADILAKSPWLHGLDPEQQVNRTQEVQADFRARYEGAMRALLDLLPAVEDGAAAVKVVVLADPAMGWSAKRKEG